MPHVMISRKKCTGCHMCELACSAYHEGAYRPSVARLYSECNPTTTEIKGHTCLQTGCAKCQQVCPNDAIVTKRITVKPFQDISTMLEERLTQCCVHVGTVGDDGAPQCAPFCAVQAWGPLARQRVSTAKGSLPVVERRSAPPVELVDSAAHQEQ